MCTCYKMKKKTWISWITVDFPHPDWPTSATLIGWSVISWCWHIIFLLRHWFRYIMGTKIHPHEKLFLLKCRKKRAVVIPFLPAVCWDQEIVELPHWVWGVRINFQIFNLVCCTWLGRRIWLPASRCCPWWRWAWARPRRCSRSLASDLPPQRFAGPANVFEPSGSCHGTWTSITLMSIRAVTEIPIMAPPFNTRTATYEM